MPILRPAPACNSKIVKLKVVAIGATLVDVVLAAATAFVAAVTAVVVSCCCSLQALQLVLLPLSLVYVLSCCSLSVQRKPPRALQMHGFFSDSERALYSVRWENRCAGMCM